MAENNLSMDNPYYVFCINNASAWLQRRGASEEPLLMNELAAATEAIAACWCITAERVTQDLLLANPKLNLEGKKNTLTKPADLIHSIYTLALKELYSVHSHKGA